MVTTEKVSFVFKKRKISFNVKECVGIQRVLGLMFKSKNAGALIFKFRKPTKGKIHSLFVFFPFVAVWLNKNGQVVDLRKVKPFTFVVSSKKKYSSLIEIPINSKYKEKIKFLVGD